MDHPAGGHTGSGRMPDAGLQGRFDELQYAMDQSAIVAATDVAGTITYVNDKFCEISGYSRGELLGQNHRVINSGYHPREFFARMYREIAAGRVWRDEIRNRAKNGSIYWVDTTIVPFLTPDHRPYQYVSIRYDITKRRQTEQKLREQVGLVQIGKMASVVAHEVRNPLAGIRGALQVLGQRLPDDSREAEVVDEAIVRIDTLNGIVQDLLLFAQPRPLKLAPVSVHLLVKDTISLFRDDPRFSNISVETAIDDDSFIVDGDQLKLALVNLLLNAAQSMPDGGTVRVESRVADPCHEIRILDEGAGIPETVRDHLFEPFFTTKTRGTGLGLPTARRIVELHGGRLDLRNAAGGGTVATIRVPIRPRATDCPVEPTGRV